MTKLLMLQRRVQKYKGQFLLFIFYIILSVFNPMDSDENRLAGVRECKIMSQC